MGFQWSELNTGTKITTEKYQELIDNIKQLENDLQLDSIPPGSKWNWSEGEDPFAKTYIIGEDLFEIRDATDNLDDNNYCRGHKSDYKATYDSTKHSTYNPTHYATYKNDLHTGLDSGLHNYHSSYYPGIDSYDGNYRNYDNR